MVKGAFQTAQTSNGKEQDFVYELRSGSTYIPELALVAEDNGKLIGHIMLSRSFVTNAGGQYEMLLLAPISVVLERRNQAVGSGLIKEGFRLALEMGFKSVILVGNPDYYHRFGFRPAIEFGINHVHEIPDENVMACELVPGGLSGVRGTTDCC